MELYSSNDLYKLYQGNMLDMLEVIEPNSIDSIITDPPYELNFMSKGWDNAGVSFQPDTWKKCYEVLKDGGYLLAFGGSRTFHRIACTIEDAGFEIRDTIMWLYGSGFPKSMDISKSLDKRNKNTKEEYIKFGNYLKEKREENKISKIDLGKKLFNFDSNREDVPIQSWEIGKEIPTKDFYLKLKEILKLNDTFDWLIERKEAEREVIGKGKAGLTKGTIANFAGTTEFNITAPSTDLAKKWNGWGTALKPSFEPIIVARKPFKGSLVDNVIKNGIGGININECRVATNDTWYRKKQDTNTAIEYQRKNKSMYAQKSEGEMNENGRFPANTILTYDETDFEEVCGGFPNTKSTYNSETKHENIIHRDNADFLKYGYKTRIDSSSYNDSGSASRYFYNAKASKKDRDEGLDNQRKQKVNDGRQTPIDNPFQRGETPRRNVHPTVKPTSLMQYLVRLVTPNGGTILDPFNGSGSTGKAVMYENKERNKNYKYIGIEMTEEYLPISKARIEYVCKITEEEKNKERQLSIYDLQ